MMRCGRNSRTIRRANARIARMEAMVIVCSRHSDARDLQRHARAGSRASPSLRSRLMGRFGRVVTGGSRPRSPSTVRHRLVADQVQRVCRRPRRHLRPAAADRPQALILYAEHSRFVSRPTGANTLDVSASDLRDSAECGVRDTPAGTCRFEDRRAKRPARLSRLPVFRRAADPQQRSYFQFRDLPSAIHSIAVASRRLRVSSVFASVSHSM